MEAQNMKEQLYILVILNCFIWSESAWVGKGPKNQARGQQSQMMKGLIWNAKEFWFYSEQDGVCIWARHLGVIIESSWQPCES